jgi:hypothetical protein
VTTVTEAPAAFTYDVLDPADMPARNVGSGPGRPDKNPHRDAVKNIAGTGQGRSFTLSDPNAGVPATGDAPERDKLVNRHIRYLRMAAHDCDRGIRVAWDVQPNGYLIIKFQDKEYIRHTRRTVNDGATE